MIRTKSITKKKIKILTAEDLILQCLKTYATLIKCFLNEPMPCRSIFLSPDAVWNTPSKKKSTFICYPTN